MKKQARLALAALMLAVFSAAVLACTYATGNPTSEPHKYGALEIINWDRDLDGSSTGGDKIVSGIEGQPLPALDAGALTWTDAGWTFQSATVTSGDAGQFYVTNDAGIAKWVYPHGDVDASATDPGALTVNAIQGVGVSTSSPSSNNVLAYSSGLWRPTALSTSNITPGTAGTFLVTNGSSATAWSTLDTFETTHGRIFAGGSGSDTIAAIGPNVGNETSYASLWLLPHGGTASASNTALNGDGSTFTTLNAPSGGTAYFDIGGTAALSASSSLITLYDATVAFTNTVSAPMFGQSQATSDVATQNLTLEAQAPYASASTNKLAGDVIVNTAASVSGGAKYGGLSVNYNGTSQFRFGTYNSGGGFAGMWALDGGSPGGTNFIFLSDGSSTFVNAPSGSGNIHFRIGDNNSPDAFLISATANVLGYGTLQYDSSISSGVFGTSKSGATLQLNGDNATNVAKLSTYFEHQTQAIWDELGSTPSAPASNTHAQYVDTDGHLKVQDSNGNVVVLQ